MLLLGTLSVFQLIALPGLLLIRLFPAHRSRIEQAAYVFALSLLANYIVVFVLVAFGLYLRSVVLALFALELAALAWFMFNDHNRKKKEPGPPGIWGGVARAWKDIRNWWRRDRLSAGLYMLFGALALLAAGFLLVVWAQNLGSVYQAWDSWASWDRWAEKWANNSFPGDTWEYPQMIPLLLSISYKFIGTVAVKFFGKSIMPLFALLIVLLLIDLGRRYRSFAYLLGAGLAFYSIDLFLSKYYIEAYADIPVAAMGLLAVYTLFLARDAKAPKARDTFLLLGALVSAAAGVTKQTGLYLAALYPVFSYLWVLAPAKMAPRQAYRQIGRNLLLTLVIVVPWYALIEYKILTGSSVSNINYVIDEIYEGQSLFERFLAAIASLKGVAYWYLVLGLSLPILPRAFQQLSLLVIFPFSILWALFLSYEPRNLATALPLLAMTNGVAVSLWVERLRAFVRKPRIKKQLRRLSSRAGAFVTSNFGRIALVALLAALLLVSDWGPLGRSSNAQILIESQTQQERELFEPALNRKLYIYFGRTGGPQPVLTDYPIGWLPDLEDMWRNVRFRSLAQFEQELAYFKNVELLLLPMHADPAILDFVQSRLDSGEYELIFTEANYRLILIGSRE